MSVDCTIVPETGGDHVVGIVAAATVEEEVDSFAVA